jgi:hypothetical protein
MISRSAKGSMVAVVGLALGISGSGAAPLFDVEGVEIT